MADTVNWAEAVDEQEQVTSGVAGLNVSPADQGDVETSKAEASLLTKILRTKLVDNTNDVEVQQNDPTSPLYSARSFEELNLYVCMLGPVTKYSIIVT